MDLHWCQCQEKLLTVGMWKVVSDCGHSNSDSEQHSERFVRYILLECVSGSSYIEEAPTKVPALHGTLARAAHA